ncbi:hypothetical protein [Catenulispora subtropica]
MQALLDVIGCDGPELSLTALADPSGLDLPALRAHSWLLLVNAVSAYGAGSWPEYADVVMRLIELGADPDAEQHGVTPRTLASSVHGLALPGDGVVG